MGLSLPQQAQLGPDNLPYRAISGNLPTSAPTAATVHPKDAHGIVPDTGIVVVQVSAACVISIYTWMPASKTWLPPGSSTDSYQKTFDDAGYDYFVAVPGSRYRLAVASGTITAYVSTEAAPTT